MLEAVGAVPDVDDVGARIASYERPDQDPAFIGDVVLDRPSLLDELAERVANKLVVDGEPEPLMADGERIRDVVAEEEEDDGREAASSREASRRGARRP